VKLPPEAPRIHTAQPLAAGVEIELEESAGRHVAGALRLRPGADLRLFNGQGGEYAAQVLSTERRRVRVAVGEFVQHDCESPLAITLGLGISRGERMDYAIQKSTELGVAGIVPLVTERTEVRLKAEREARKLKHWEQVITSACEQCGRNRIPSLGRPTPLNDWLQAASGQRRLVLHHRADSGLPDPAAPASVDLLVGPEGGLSPAEIESALAAGFEAVRLGPRVLRTETAPVAALSILQFHWGDMQ
jgi:16S rRNA (uracil1498-N3)-methyltransferase